MANEEINKLSELLNTYDDTVIDLVHSHLQNHNEDVRRKRINGHPDTQAVFDRANALLFAASRKGKLHFVERHGSSARVFFCTEHKLFVFENDAVSEINFGPFAEKLNSISFFSYTNKQTGKKVEYIQSVLNNFFHSSQEISSDANKYQNFFSGRKLYQQLSKNDNRYSLTSEGITIERTSYNFIARQIIIHNDYDVLKFPNGLNSKNGIHPRMALDEAKSFMYVSDPNKGICVVDTNPKANKRITQLSLPTIKSPLSLAVYNAQRLLLIRNHSDQFIYGYQMDSKLSFPEFQTFEHAIELPRRSLQAGNEFTISCWLKKSGKRDTKWKTGFKRGLVGFYFEESNKELIFYYSENGAAKTEKIFVNFSLENWFHLSIVKNEKTFAFYINGAPLSELRAPAAIDTSLRLASSNEPIIFCVPGFTASELSIWNKARTNKEITTSKLAWLTNQPENLSGYWRLAVSNGEKLWTEKQDKFTDLSGHGNNGTTQNGRWKLDASPLPRLMKLYKTNGSPSFINQSFSIDNPAHHIYWVEKTANGLTQIMRGSSFGHTAPIVFKKMNEQIVSIHVESGDNNQFENLAIAHRNKRNAIHDAIELVSHQTENGHKEIVALHDAIVKSHEQAQEHANNTPSNRTERTEIQAHYVEQITAIHNKEKAQERELADNRLKANAEAQRIILNAQLEANNIRRQTGVRRLENHRKNEQ